MTRHWSAPVSFACTASRSVFDAAQTLALAKPPRGDRSAIVTNGGGIGILATDALIDQGGHLAELSEDTVSELNQVLPPLNMRRASELLSRTRIYRLLKGFRGQPAANLDAIALTLVRLSQMIVDLAEVCELDINPLLVYWFGVMALDTRIRVERTDKRGADCLSIRPYPKELEETLSLGDGRTLLPRPIRSEDEPSLQGAFAKLTPEEVRLRFFVPMSTLSQVMAARFTQIDYD